MASLAELRVDKTALNFHGEIPNFEAAFFFFFFSNLRSEITQRAEFYYALFFRNEASDDIVSRRLILEEACDILHSCWLAAVV